MTQTSRELQSGIHDHSKHSGFTSIKRSSGNLLLMIAKHIGKFFNRFFLRPSPDTPNDLEMMWFGIEALKVSIAHWTL